MAVVGGLLWLGFVAFLVVMFFAVVQLFAIKRYLKVLAGVATASHCPQCDAPVVSIDNQPDGSVRCDKCRSRWTPLVKV